MKLGINLKETSTWRGIVYLIAGIGSLFGLLINIETALSIASIGLVIAGAVGFALTDAEIDDLLYDLRAEDLTNGTSKNLF